MIDRRLLLAGGMAMISTACAADGNPFRRVFGRRSKGGWSRGADMPFAVQEIYPAAFVADGAPVIVNAGGLTFDPRFANNVTDAVTVYDPATDKWRSGVSLPQPRHHIALAAVGDHLYAIGGFGRDDDGGWRMRRSVWRIRDIDNGVWSPMESMPAPQAEAVTLSHEGRIHVIGGRSPKAERNLEWNDHSDTGTQYCYDPAEDSWETRAPLPSPRNSAAGAIIGDEIFVFSGRTVASGNTPTCHAYNPATDSWREIAPLPQSSIKTAPHGQGGNAAVALGGKAYVFGGEWFSDGGGVYPDTWEYDPVADKWRSFALLPAPRHGLGAVALNGAAFVIGGALQAGGNGTSALTEIFRP